MIDKDNGGPAFPTQTYDQGAAMNGLGVTVTDQPGMTLRDYFAAKALPFVGDLLPPMENVDGDLAIKIVAEFSYKMADAMIEARKK